LNKNGIGDGDEDVAVDDEGDDALFSYDPGNNLDDASSCPSLRSLLGRCSCAFGRSGSWISDPSMGGESI
jgi:hypothetical protein